jgi:hypothetical protein
MFSRVAPDVVSQLTHVPLAETPCRPARRPKQKSRDDMVAGAENSVRIADLKRVAGQCHFG